MMHGDLDKAIAAYRAAVRLEPGHAEAHCNLGLVFGRQSRFAEPRRTQTGSRARIEETKLALSFSPVGSRGREAGRTRSQATSDSGR